MNQLSDNKILLDRAVLGTHRVTTEMSHRPTFISRQWGSWRSSILKHFFCSHKIVLLVFSGWRRYVEILIVFVFILKFSLRRDGSSVGGIFVRISPDSHI